MLELLRRPSPARRFFLTAAQSSIGTGIGAVALMIAAYQAFRSPWAVTAVLLADFLPSMLLGPIAGALVDRRSRRTCLVAAQLIGAVAFAGLAFAHSFVAIVALALLAGLGNALAVPAVMASIPEVVEEPRLPAATSLYSLIEEAGVVAGPAIAAVLLAGGDPASLMAINAVSFAASAALLMTVRFRPAVAEAAPRSASLLSGTREGIRELRALAGVRSLVGTSVFAVFFFGMFSVGYPLFVAQELHGSPAAFSLLVMILSIGMTAGALVGSRRPCVARWRRQYLAGLALMGGALMLVIGVSAIAAFAAAMLVIGYGNGITVVHERLLIQHTVPAGLQGRVFGIRRMLISWAFCGSYLGAGAMAGAFGSRWLLAIAGAGMLLAFAFGARALRGEFAARSPRLAVAPA